MVADFVPSLFSAGVDSVGISKGKNKGKGKGKIVDDPAFRERMSNSVVGGDELILASTFADLDRAIDTQQQKYSLSLTTDRRYDNNVLATSTLNDNDNDNDVLVPSTRNDSERSIDTRQDVSCSRSSEFDV